MRAKKILMAEDDERDVELALIALGQYNLVNEVVVASNGVEALDYLYYRGKFADRPKGKPIVIFLDLKMPKIDGLEVLKTIKNDPNLRTIPIVVMTSSREDRDILQSYTHGVNAYVVKPVAFDKFVEVVKTLGLFWVLTNEPPK